MPHFQLVTTDGTVLGTRELGRPDWPPGSVIYTGPDEPNLRLVEGSRCWLLKRCRGLM
jgi:hypothetical protein